MTSKNEAIDKLIERRNNRPHNSSLSALMERDCEVYIEVTNGDGYKYKMTQSFTPPAPEYEAGIVGVAWNTDSHTRTIVFYGNRVEGMGHHCYTEKDHDILIPESDEEFDNFAPLLIYAQLEQTEKALENMGKEYCEAVNSKQKGCSECPIKDRCSIHDDTNHDGLVSHFLKEARDGKSNCESVKIYLCGGEPCKYFDDDSGQEEHCIYCKVKQDSYHDNYNACTDPDAIAECEATNEN